LIWNKAAFAVHWTKGLERWFEDGVATQGLGLIQVHATRIRYCDGVDEGEIVV
jgi:general stress protein 26